jgi:hypothetical protein
LVPVSDGSGGHPVLDSEAVARTRTAAIRGATIVVSGAVIFFVALGALPDFREFIAGPGDGTLTEDALQDYRAGTLADHRTQVLVGYGLIGLGQLLLGVGAAVLARGIARAESGWRATSAGWGAWLIALGGVAGGVTYAWPGYWFDDEALVLLGLTSVSTAVFVAGFLLLAAGFVAVAAVLVSGHPWPRWAGVALVVFAVLPFVTFLPLFFQVGAVIAAIGIVIGLRPARLARLAE